KAAVIAGVAVLVGVGLFGLLHDSSRDERAPVDVGAGSAASAASPTASGEAPPPSQGGVRSSPFSGDDAADTADTHGASRATTGRSSAFVVGRFVREDGSPLAGASVAATERVRFGGERSSHTTKL